MYIFLDNNGKIINAHLDHIFKSYYQVTGINLYYMNLEELKIYSKTKQEVDIFSEEVVIRTKEKLNLVLMSKKFNNKDSFLLEIFESIYNLSSVIYHKNKIIGYFISEAFFVDVEGNHSINQIHYRLNNYYDIPIEIDKIRKFKKISAKRQVYLGQLIHHLISKSIYIGKQNFIPKKEMKKTEWGKDIELEAYSNNSYLVNISLINQIGEALLNGDIKKGIEIYRRVTSFGADNLVKNCNIERRKYELISFASLLLYNLASNVNGINEEINRELDKYVLMISKENREIFLNQLGAEIIKKFGEILSYAVIQKYSENIKKAINYINKNYAEKISLENVAMQIPMNKNYFSTQFKEEVGLSFTNYVNRKRIEKSIYLMKNSEYSLTDIAFSIGFDSPNYFATIFKKIMKLTPSQYYKKVNIS